MDYSLANAIEYALHLAGKHRWVAFGGLVLFLLVILYNVIRQQYEPQHYRDSLKDLEDSNRIDL